MAEPEKKVVEANEFVLKDDQGRVRARIGLSNDNQPAINLLDEAGKSRLILALDEDQSPSATFQDEEGRKRANLGTAADKVALIFYRATGESSAFLISSDVGITGLAMSDREDVTRAILGVQPDGNPMFFLNEGQQNAGSEEAEGENSQ